MYQGSLAVQQASAVKSGGVGHAGGELSSTSQMDIVTGEIGDAPTTSEDPPAEGWEKDDNDDPPPTLPPPTPSPSKRRFSALVSESADSSTPSAIPGSSSAGISGISPVSRSAASSSSKRGRMTGAIAISSLGHELSDIKGLLCMDLEMTKSNAEAREERKRLEREQLERNRLERNRLEQERLEHEQLEQERLEREHREQVLDHQKDPVLGAIDRMQEMETDLSADHQAILADLFNKEHDSTKVYLALKTDPLRKAWIKRRLTQAGSG